MNRLATLFVVALFAVSASSFLLQPQVDASALKELWSTWKSIHNKVYAESEEIFKFATFVENYFKVISQNEQHPDAKFALNLFADLTEEEFKAQYLNGLKVDQDTIDSQPESTIDYSILSIPDSVDWRTKGVLTPVKNQGNCGSCWAFSATGAIEGLNAIKSGKLQSFSEQQLVSCEPQGDKCQGGWMQWAFEYAAKEGIETEENYPYIAQNGTCKYDASKAQHVLSGYQNVTVNNVDALKTAIATQPVSVAVDATIFQFYFGGVIRWLCGKNLNHGVLAVGYGNIKGKDAFIVKNSWTAKWGDKGYCYVSTDPKANGGAGVCGILAAGSYPTA